MRKNRHIVSRIKEDSIATELGIEIGDEILSINGEEIEDIFDYQFLCENEYIEVLLKKPDGEEWFLEIDKDEDEDLGVVFENGLMDEYRSCSNKCIFCFIDQMPKGMRETLYFKDDDARLSFLQGNYVTLTNLSDNDIDRIIRYNLSPINISFHTTNPELRCKMLNNRFAGEALKKAKKLADAGLTLNGQIVLCKSINDGEELERTLKDLYGLAPQLQSLSIVPVGLTKFRDGLFPLETFDSNDAAKLIKRIKKWQDKAYKEYGIHWVHLSDEWYINANVELPKEEDYDGYLQIANGVGTIRSMYNEVMEELNAISGENPLSETLSMITGTLAYPYVKRMCEEIEQRFPQKKINVYAINNYFFGETITVTGLLTGGDITNQLKDKELGNRLLIPENVLKADEDIFLDDMTLDEFKDILQVNVCVVQSNGFDFVDTVIFED